MVLKNVISEKIKLTRMSLKTVSLYLLMNYIHLFCPGSTLVERIQVAYVWGSTDN